MATTGALRIVFWVLLALCSHPIYVRAQSISFTNIDYTVTAGSPFAISWYGNGDPVTISLMNGPSSNLQKVADIATTFTSPYIWTPSASLPAGWYAFSITQSGYINYSPQFAISGATGSPSVIASTTSAGATSGITSATSLNTSTTYAPGLQQAQPTPTPTPAYVAKGGLSSGNATWPYYATVSGTGMALPTGTSRLGQYEAFEGAAAERVCDIWRGVVAAAVLFALFA